MVFKKDKDSIAHERLLLKKSAKGDTDAFEELAQKYQKQIFNIALRLVNSSEDAADISQEVLLKLYRALPRFRGDAAFSTWVYRITVNTARDFMRKTYRHKEYLYNNWADEDDADKQVDIADYSAIPEDIYLNREVEQYLLALIENLSPKYKVVFTLREISGLGYQEIADILSISLGTVKSRLSRARKVMQDKIMADKEQYPHLSRLIGQKERD